mmetsp:Transcript_12205/g.25258  ORF Transcript_12205/g.25258 Transcript_12205/m.25258 type:complete len:211 (-) Transcript_12205:1045-1677(-)
MLFAKSFNFGQTHHFHRIFFRNNFAQDPGGRSARQTTQIHRGFGMSIPCQNTSRSCAQGQNVSGTGKITGLHLAIGQHLDGRGTIRGRNARGDAVLLSGIHRHGKGGALGILIVASHGWQIQFFQTLIFQRNANDTGRISDNLGHIQGCAIIGGHDKITFIFSVHIIHDHDHFSTRHGLNGFFDRLTTKAISVTTSLDSFLRFGIIFHHE